MESLILGFGSASGTKTVEFHKYDAKLIHRLSSKISGLSKESYLRERDSRWLRLFHCAAYLPYGILLVQYIPVPGHRPHYGAQQEVMEYSSYLRLTGQIYPCLFWLAGACPCTRTSTLARQPVRVFFAISPVTQR